MRRTQQSLLEWKGVGSEFWLATTNFNLLEKFRLHFQNGATVCAKCWGCQQLHWRNSGCDMESPTSASPIHANNQAMRDMAYSQWHCWGLKAYSTTMHPCTRNSSFFPTLSFQACWIEKQLPLGDYHSHLRPSQEYDIGDCQPM